MRNIKKIIIENTKQRQILRYLAYVLLFSSVALFVWWMTDVKTTEIHKGVKIFEKAETEQVIDALVASSSQPVRLKIPSINITVPFEGSLGLDENGAMRVPNAYDTVGWYKHGPLPGALGPAVVLGHVDSREGPAVFFYLGQVVRGDEVLIEREDGSVLQYTITGLERVEQDSFPTEHVFDEINYAGLRLITCSGTYDRDVQTYSHNLIVYAELSAVE